MSSLTAEGRRKNRDYQRDWIIRGFGKDRTYASLPMPQRVTLSELKLIGRDLYRYIRERGVILPDGTVNPAVEAHRKNAHEQLVSLQVFMELNRAQRNDPVVDLVQLMAGTETGDALDAARPAAEPADEPEAEGK